MLRPSFPSPVLRFRLPLPSTGSSWREFPGFLGTTRSSDSLRSVPPRFVSFAWRLPPFRPCSFHLFRALGTGGLELGHPVLRPGLTVEIAGPPRFLGDPNACVPCSLTPAESVVPRHRGTPDAAFRQSDGVGLRSLVNLGAQSHGPHARCLRFAARVAPTPRKTRFRLVATLCRAGSLPLGRIEGFCSYMGFLLLQAWPGAPDF
jgi:hypothetical protein